MPKVAEILIMRLIKSSRNSNKYLDPRNLFNTFYWSVSTLVLLLLQLN